jgi:hypothetical protein
MTMVKTPADGKKTSVSDPDSIGQGIRIWIRNPDPERQKFPTKIKKVKKFHVLKWWMFSFEGGRILLQLGRPLRRRRDK